MATQRLNGDQWCQHVRSLHSGDGTRSFVAHVLKQRGETPTSKPEGFTWEQYIQARRANATADGKARARVGHEPKKLSADKLIQLRQSTIRPTSPSRPPAENKRQTAESKQEMPEPTRSKGKLGRVEAALSSSAKHLKSVLSRSQKPDAAKANEPAKPKREPLLPLRGIKQAAKEIVQKAKKQIERKPQKVASIPPPAPRRGR